MAKKKRRGAYSHDRYNIKTLHEDREYGFFWYEWLWKVLRPVTVFLCSLLIVIGLVSIVWDKVNDRFLTPIDPNSTETVEFVIESGTSISKIGKNLETAKLLKSADVFKYLVQFKGLTNVISYGTYTLSPAMDVNDIISVLTSGSQTNERTITIIPGWTCEDIADYLVSQGALDSRDEFLELCGTPEKFITYSYPLSEAYSKGTLAGRRYALEGYLAPDTYQVFKSASAESIIRTILAQGNKVIDDVFYAEHAEYTVDEEGVYHEVETYKSTLTMDETMILASIIEKEAGKTSDYKYVSAVFYNRMTAGYRLESDATVNYLTRKNRYIVSSSDLSIESAYNTYFIEGLPVGPICSPSKAAIEAARYPDLGYITEGYMFFCAKEPDSGELAFAKTVEEHNANVAMYRPSWEAFDTLQGEE